MNINEDFFDDNIDNDLLSDDIDDISSDNNSVDLVDKKVYPYEFLISYTTNDLYVSNFETAAVKIGNFYNYFLNAFLHSIPNHSKPIFYLGPVEDVNEVKFTEGYEIHYNNSSDTFFIANVILKADCHFVKTSTILKFFNVFNWNSENIFPDSLTLYKPMIKKPEEKRAKQLEIRLDFSFNNIWSDIWQKIDLYYIAKALLPPDTEYLYEKLRHDWFSGSIIKKPKYSDEDEIMDIIGDNIAKRKKYISVNHTDDMNNVSGDFIDTFKYYIMNNGGMTDLTNFNVQSEPDDNLDVDFNSYNIIDQERIFREYCDERKPNVYITIRTGIYSNTDMKMRILYIFNKTIYVTGKEGEVEANPFIFTNLKKCTILEALTRSSGLQRIADALTPLAYLKVNIKMLIKKIEIAFKVSYSNVQKKEILDDINHNLKYL